MSQHTLNVSIVVEADSENEASQCLESALSNMMSGSFQSFGFTKSPRVLVVVEDGEVDTITDNDVEVVVFDKDNYFDDPENYERIPKEFADLAIPHNLPVQK